MQGYASDVNRKEKAEKINRILKEELGKPVRGMSILDVGTGNGEIANYFAKAGNDVWAVDVQKAINDKEVLFSFSQLTDETLPFADNSFDIVISNMVIEHVANAEKHLSEIYRVAKCGGGVYVILRHPTGIFQKKFIQKHFFCIIFRI